MLCNTAENLVDEAGNGSEAPENADVIEIVRNHHERESLSESFNDELEAWARHSFASNGFGDY